MQSSTELTDHGSRLTDHGPIALIGANGMLAGKVRRQAAAAGCAVSGFDLPGFDLTDREQVLRELGRLRPAVIVNCAAYTNVDGAEAEEELATRINGRGVAHLAEAALDSGAALVHVSTDYVFDGRKREPYLEADPVNPISAYGRSKLAGEQALLASGLERYFIIRTSWLFGPGGKNFVETIIRLARERDELRIVADQTGAPTYTGDLAAAIFRLLALTHHGSRITDHGSRLTAHDPFGIYHFANAGACSWHEFAAEIVSRAGACGEPLRVKRVVPIATGEYPLPAARPAYSVFSTEKYRRVTGAAPPPWRDALDRYLRERSAASDTGP